MGRFRLAVLWIGMLATGARAYEYALDDGTGNFNIGPSQFDAQMLWGNYFDAAPGFETIQSIAVAFAGSVPIGETVTALLFDDPTDDLDPTDAVLVAQAAGMTIAAAPNTFLYFDIADTAVSGGFFVAAMMNLQRGQVAARMDPNTPAGRSWLFFDSAIDVGDLGASPLYYNMASTPFNGSWMVRAQAVPEPHLVLPMILASAIVVKRRQR